MGSLYQFVLDCPVLEDLLDQKRDIYRAHAARCPRNQPAYPFGGLDIDIVLDLPVYHFEAHVDEGAPPLEAGGLHNVSYPCSADYEVSLLEVGFGVLATLVNCGYGKILILEHDANRETDGIAVSNDNGRLTLALDVVVLEDLHHPQGSTRIVEPLRQVLDINRLVLVLYNHFIVVMA